MKIFQGFISLSGFYLWMFLGILTLEYIISGLFRAIIDIKNKKSDKKRERNYAIENHIKSKALCNACEYEHYCADRSNDCEACGQYDAENICKCYEIDNGEKCPYFKPIEKRGFKK